MFASASIIIFFLLVFQPWIDAHKIRFRPQGAIFDLATNICGVLTTMYLVYITCSEIYILKSKTFEPMAQTTESGRKLEKFRKLQGGMTLFLIPDNSLRPLTIDSAIYKGATDVFDARWEKSQLMKQLFPDRWYIHGAETPGTGHLPELQHFKTIVYSYFPSDHDSKLKNLKLQYGIDMRGFTCPFKEPTGNGAILVACSPKKRV